ncbi:MAG: radical SAM protein [Deltaproteobacteria bacterium]|nr:radical SAM protein [Deltaproteobacteria bacterium]MBI5902152.1 radical SAM protein [Deltaproteobacteria bacterium]
MNPLIIPDNYNYIAVFLTLACNLKCAYCINRFGMDGSARRHLSGAEWVEGLNRIISRDDLPLTLQGGEPSLHRGFIHILNNIRPGLNIDILTNLQFDGDDFIRKVDPERIKRKAPYASIRVSYHPSEMALEPLARKVMKLRDAGFSIGIWGVMHPSQEDDILKAREYCRNLGIDFRLKEFLGEHNGRMYGTLKYEGACDRKGERTVLCKTTELIIGPEGGVYRCHSDLYEGRPPVGDISDPAFRIEDVFRVCDHYGQCNPCDIKVKTDRFQQSGHTSVEIRELTRA